jgi:hypothetical protein
MKGFRDADDHLDGALGTARIWHRDMSKCGEWLDREARTSVLRKPLASLSSSRGNAGTSPATDRGLLYLAWASSAARLLLTGAGWCAGLRRWVVGVEQGLGRRHAARGGRCTVGRSVLKANVRIGLGRGWADNCSGRCAEAAEAGRRGATIDIGRVGDSRVGTGHRLTARYGCRGVGIVAGHVARSVGLGERIL